MSGLRLLLTLSLLVLFAPVLAQAASAPNQRRVLSEDQTRRHIEQLEESIVEQEEKLESNVKRERSILVEVQRLEQALDEQRTQLEDLRARQEEKRALIAVRERELENLNQEHRHLQEHLMKRLRAHYLMGKTGLFNALFSSTTMGELVRGNEAFHSMSTYDRGNFLQFRESLHELNEARLTLTREQAELEQLITEAKEHNEQLQLAADQQKAFLKKIQAERGLHEQAIHEMTLAQNELTSSLTRMADEGRLQNVRGFLQQRGNLPPPIFGPVIRSFMEKDSSGEGAALVNGITIGVDGEQEVQAVWGGTVIYADYMTGYGKTVIIEHAPQYYTVTSKLSKIQVSEKSRVEAGDVLGETDNFATMIGKGLYFEVRHGTSAEDPMSWIRQGALVKGSPRQDKPADAPLNESIAALPPETEPPGVTAGLPGESSEPEAPSLTTVLPGESAGPEPIPNSPVPVPLPGADFLPPEPTLEVSALPLGPTGENILPAPATQAAAPLVIAPAAPPLTPVPLPGANFLPPEPVTGASVLTIGRPGEGNAQLEPAPGQDHALNPSAPE